MQTLIVRKKGSTVAVVAVADVFWRARGKFFYIRIRAALSMAFVVFGRARGQCFFYVRTYVLRQEVRYFLRASVKEDECCLLHARLGVLVQRLLRARRGRAMAVRSDY